MTLAGGGSRARKRAARLPSTAAEIARARSRFTVAKLGHPSDVSRASFMVGDRMYSYREEIRGPVLKGCRCSFFVTEAVGPALRTPSEGSDTRSLPRTLTDAPFQASSLCSGGRRVTGHTSHATLSAAQREVEYRAEWARRTCGGRR